MAENVLELKDLEVCFDTPQGTVEAVRGVNLTVKEGEILCLVGESGCGKTVLCHSVMHLLPRNGYIRSGSVYVDGTDITYCTEKMMRQIRGKTMSMVFQDPLTTLNPTVPIGKQITETIHKHQRCSRQEAKEQAIKMLQMVGIPDPEKRFFFHGINRPSLFFICGDRIKDLFKTVSQSRNQNRNGDQANPGEKRKPPLSACKIFHGLR